MCGIAGSIGNMALPESKASLLAMLTALAHRGPDDQGIEITQAGNATVALGNRRLAILDLSPLGHQPMVNQDTRDILAYNGEIYNFREIRDRLRAEGINFRGNSDTEVLLRALQRWGEASLDMLRGMYAFAFWNAQRSRLFLARDHVGIKPLYYVSIPSRGLIFASEIRALVASRAVEQKMSAQALASYLAYGAVQEPATILKGVHPLPAGTYVEIDPLGTVCKKVRYWAFPSPPGPGEKVRRESSVVEEGRMLLTRSVARHLASDVPVGIFLSAGLDSTAIAGLASSQSSPDSIHTFTVTFPDQRAYDEGRIANDTAKRLGVSHQECPVSDETALEWTRRWLASIDQPSMDGLNTYIVSRAVHEQGLIVALSGQGGDEIFGGYPSFRRVQKIRRLLRMFEPLPPSVRAALGPVVTAPMNKTAAAKVRDLTQAPPSDENIYFQQRRLLSNQDMHQLGISSDELGLDPNFQDPGLDRSPCLVSGDTVASVQRLETAYYLGNTLLRDGDVFSMANSLELRVPFLDRDLIDWAMRLPGDALLPRGEPGKALLRLICKDYFSAHQLTRPKSGFTLPLSQWLRSSLRDTMDQGLQHVKDSGYLRPQGVDQIRDRFLRESESPAWSRVWALVVLGHWLKSQNLTSLSHSNHPG
jgi:asparagine synthase (glutamine-hydrolysing)